MDSMILPWRSRRRRSARVLPIAALFLAACSRSPAPSESASTPPAGADPATPAVRVYVSDETGGNVIVVDASGEILQRIAVGKRPRGVRLSPDGSQLFVALSGSPISPPGVDESKLPPPDRAADGIGAVDLASHRLVRTYESGQDPETFDVSLDGRTLYVSNEETAEMSVLDLQSGKVTRRVAVGGEPEGVTVRPDGREVYVTCEADNEVFAVDTSSLAVSGRMKVGPRPRAIAFTPDGKTAFVTAETGAAVDVIDTATHKVTGSITIPQSAGTPTAPRPMGALLSADGREVFVSLGRARSVAVLDAASRKFVRTIEDVGERPWGIGMSPDARKLYTANGPSGDVSVIDIVSGKVERRIAVGGSPWGIAVRADKR
jgi:YVTN family beta-propeller protein